MGVGLVPTASVTDNAILRVYSRPPVSRGPLLDRVEAERFTNDLLDTAGVRVATLQTPVKLLSGGNQQRLLARRETLVASRILVAVHPTRGLDIVATDSLRQVLVDHRNQGGAVLLISEDLDEILLLADRVIVMFRGRIVGESLTPRDDRHRIGLWMGGASAVGRGCS
jgi:simple sugar transport system ATP-binding protein